MKILNRLLVLFCATTGSALAQDAESYYTYRRPAPSQASPSAHGNIRSYGYTGKVIREAGPVGKTLVGKVSGPSARPAKAGGLATGKEGAEMGAMLEKTTDGVDQASDTHDRSAVSHPTVTLPPNMERGVRELEESVGELPGYTSAMSKHVQQNGLRGFLAVTPELKAQGQSLGGRMGEGILGIMTDVGKEMATQTTPERPAK